MKRFVMSLIVAAALAGGLSAQIEQRKENQQDRIAQGVASGELTPRETARLERREANLNRTIRKDRKSGGGLSARERAQIRRRQNSLSRDIHRQKHDAQKQ